MTNSAPSKFATPRVAIRISAFSVRLMFCVSLLSVLLAPSVFGQAPGDYRSAASGNWNVTATWETFNGTTWVAAGASPTSAKGVITIRSPHLVTNSANGLTIDQAVVDSGATLQVNSAITATLANGTGTDISVSGTFINQGTVTWTGTMTVNAGGTYVHNTTGSAANALSAATLDPASTWIYRGSSTLTPPTSFSSRIYGTLIYESTSGTWTVAANTGTGICTVNSNLSVGATGAGTVSWILSGVGVTSPFNVSGNMSVGSGSTVIFASIPITLTGNFTNSGTVMVNTNAGTFTFSNNGSSAVVAGSAAAAFGNGFVVQSGKTVSLLQDITVTNATGNSTATNIGTLNCGTSVISGNGNFTNVAGATLGISSANGITSSGASGNIQVTGTRGFSPGASYVYNGIAAQATGNALPASVNNLTVSNSLAVASGGVTLTANVTVTNSLNLTLGKLITGGNTAIVADSGSISGGSSAAYVDGSLQKVWTSTGTKSFSFPIGASATYAPCNVASLVLTATGNLTASTTSSEHGNIGSSTIDSTKSANRYWTMTAAGGLGVSTYNASCTFVAADIDGGAVSNNFVMEKYNGASWSRAASTSISGSTVTGSGFTSFSDFAVGEPAAVSTDPAGVGAANPATVGRGNSTVLTVTVTPGTFPTSSGLAVSANLSAIGGSSSQQFYDDASHGDTNSGDNVFTYSTTVNTGTTLGAKSLSATITDAQSRTGSAIISVTVAGVTRTWNGGGSDDSIATAANWNTGVAPISPEDSLTFSGSTRTTPSLDSSATTPGLVFDSGASSFTLGATGGSALTMSGGTGITNDSSSSQTVNIPLTFSSAQTVKANGAGTLTLGGTVANGGNLLTVDGANNSAITGAISGGGGLTKVANGTLTLAGNNSYGGATTISGGTLAASGGSAIPNASAVTLTPGGSATLSLSASESIGSLAGVGIVALGGNNLIQTGSATTTNGGTFTGSGKLVQAGSGTLMLTNSGALGSSFITRVESGTVELNNSGAAITNLLGAGNKVELAGGTLKLSGNVQANIGINFSSLDIYSDSTLSLNRNSTAQSSTSPNLGFPLDFKGNASLAFAYNDRITNGTTTFSAAAHILEGHAKLTLGAYAVTISGPIGESGGSYSLTKDGAGQLNLSATNTYSGNTTNLAGVIALNATATLGSGTLVMAGGDLLASSTRGSAPITNPILLTSSGISTIYGDSGQTSARLFPLSGSLGGSTGTLRIGNKATVANSFQTRLAGGGFTFDRPIIVGDVSFDSATGSSLLVFYNDNSTAPQIFTGIISGSAAGGLLRTAPSSGTGGTTILAGDNTFAGGITNSGGYLGLGLDSTPTSGVLTSGPLGAGTLEFQVDPNVGIFAYGGARTVGNRIFLNGTGGTLNVLVGGTDDLTFTGTWNVGNSSKFLNVTNTGLTTISGSITNSGTGSFTKSGSGTLVLSGNNLYNGTMTNAAGSLLIHGNNYSNSIVVASGATLGGNGLIKSVTVNAGGIFAPGASVGTLTVTNLTLAATATNIFEFDAAGATNDSVAVLGALSAGTSKLVVNVSGGSLAVGTYRIFDYNTKSGSFNGIVSVGSGSVSGGIKVDEATAGQVNLIVRANTAPVANTDNFTFNKGVTAKMSVASLLANDTDADTDTLTFVSVDTTTANGVALVNNGTNIFFTSPVTNNDSFTYTITDGYSSTATGTVSITASDATGQTTGSINTTGGSVNLTFFGIPGASYTIQVSTDLSSWTDVTTVTASATGVITYSDSTPPTPAAYYRTRYNP